MVKSVSPALRAHLLGEATTVCTLWRLIREDGVVMGFTDLDRDVTYGGQLYSAVTGYSRTALTSDSSLAVDNMDLEGILSSGAITAADVRKGLYDWSELQVYLVNWQDLSQGHILLRRGWLGEFSLRGGLYITELRGLSQSLSRNFIESYTADCRADLGDERCRVDLTPYTSAGTVTGVATPRRTFSANISGGRPEGFFNGGLLVWTSGANSGESIEVRTYASGQVTLYLPTGDDIAPADNFTIRPGCDKSHSTCFNVYNNIKNHRGFPFIPGQGVVGITPDAKPT